MLILVGEDPAGLRIDYSTTSPHKLSLMPARAHNNRLDDVPLEHPDSTMERWVMTAKTAESSSLTNLLWERSCARSSSTTTPRNSKAIRKHHTNNTAILQRPRNRELTKENSHQVPKRGEDGLFVPR